MTRFLLLLSSLIAIPACASQSSSDDSDPLAGVIGGQPFTSIQAALIDLPPDLSSYHYEIMVGDFNLCRDLMSGEKPNSAYAMLYIPKTATPGTMAFGDVSDKTTAALAVYRLDNECESSTDEYVETGSVTISVLDGATIAGTVTNATTDDDPPADNDQVSGSFEVACELLPKRGCLR